MRLNDHTSAVKLAQEGQGTRSGRGENGRGKLYNGGRDAQESPARAQHAESKRPYGAQKHFSCMGPNWGNER